MILPAGNGEGATCDISEPQNQASKTIVGLRRNTPTK